MVKLERLQDLVTGVSLIWLGLNIPSAVDAQSSSMPVFDYVDIAHVLWQDSLYARKLDRAWNDVDSVCNVRTDSGLVRFDFDEWGRWMRRVRIVQVPSVDTAYNEDVVTGEMEMAVTKGIADIPNGYYQGYNGSPFPHRAGMVEMGRPVGMWRYFGENGIVVKSINLGRYGWPEGECVEYHLNGNIHWIGSYGIRKYKQLKCPACPTWMAGYGERAEYSSSVPVGEWKEFDDSGKLIQTVLYSWIED